LGAGQGRESPLVNKNQMQLPSFTPAGRWTPECSDKEEVAAFTKEPTVEAPTVELIKPLALQPTDRAIGEGWAICNPLEEHDYAITGCDSGSCFLFLYNENRANEYTAQGNTELPASRPLSRCASQSSMLADQFAKTTVMCPV